MPILFLCVCFSAQAKNLITGYQLNQPQKTQRAFDLLISHKLIKPLLGAKPYSRAFLARKLMRAQKKYKLKEKEFSLKQKRQLKMSFDFLETELYEELVLLGGLQSGNANPIKPIRLKIKRSSATLAFTQTQGRNYIDNYGFDGLYNPLAKPGSGIYYAEEGFYHQLETEAVFSLGSHFQLTFRPALESRIDTLNDTEELNPLLRELYLSTGIGIFQFDIGRKPINYSLDNQNGFLLSAMPKAFDSFQFSNNRAIGNNFSFHVMVARLGDDRHIQNPFLLSFLFNYQPWPVVDFGVSRAVMFGGSGAPSAPFLEYLTEFFFVRIGDVHQVNLTNAITNLYMRLHFPEFFGAQFSFEMTMEDFSQNVFYSLYEDSGYKLVASFRRLDKAGRFHLDLSGFYVPPIMYKHGIWKNGWSHDEYFLGHDMNGLAFRFQAQLGYQINQSHYLNFQANWESHDSDIFGNRPPAPGGKRPILREGPAEKRIRFHVKSEHNFKDKIILYPQIAYEYVDGFNFVPSDKRHHFSLELRADFLEPFVRKK